MQLRSYLLLPCRSNQHPQTTILLSSPLLNLYVLVSHVSLDAASMSRLCCSASCPIPVLMYIEYYQFSVALCNMHSCLSVCSSCLICSLLILPTHPLPLHICLSPVTLQNASQS